jgi:hypothetical protein
MVKNPSKIKNKTKRTEVYAKYKQQKQRLKRMAKEERLKTNEALGDKAPPKLVPRTIENTRILDETTVDPNDPEILGDEKDDEFAPLYALEKVNPCVCCAHNLVIVFAETENYDHDTSEVFQETV